jgi:hypothetical protein
VASYIFKNLNLSKNITSQAQFRNCIDLGTISIVLTLFGLYTITVFILKSYFHLLNFCCIICLLTYYCFFLLFGLGSLGLSVIIQNIYIISPVLLVVGLEYLTKYEDFIKIKLEKKKISNEHLTMVLHYCICSCKKFVYFL